MRPDTKAMVGVTVGMLGIFSLAHACDMSKTVSAVHPLDAATVQKIPDGSSTEATK